MTDHAFAGYPAPFVFEAPSTRSKKTQQLIWGDYVTLLGPPTKGWHQVRARGTPGWMQTKSLQAKRLLEICFVDIGQGDGAFLVLPDDRFMLVDAGESDNMLRFLSWRFNLRSDPNKVIPFDTAVISHPDQDHYKGFTPLFESPRFRFERVVHNGIVERSGTDSLGPTRIESGVRYLAETLDDTDTLRSRLADPTFTGRKTYPRMLKKALDSGRVGAMLGAGALGRYLPGFGADQDVSIEILGPKAEEVAGQHLLRWFGDVGPTKNGHSVVLKLVYGKVRVLLGGDLNRDAEEHLLTTHTGLPLPNGAAAETFLAAARRIFEVDVAKACHHGSADFTSLYLQAVNPAATVISSGDDEPYAHPRPDALGAFGKHARGERPLIFSTELARSSKENIRTPNALRAEFRALYAKRQTAASADEKAALDAQLETLLSHLERSVAVYGMINLRTDGQRVVLAQKLEDTSPDGRKWDVHCLEPDAAGVLRYVSKHTG